MQNMPKRFAQKIISLIISFADSHSKFSAVYIDNKKANKKIVNQTSIYFSFYVCWWRLAQHFYARSSGLK